MVPDGRDRTRRAIDRPGRAPYYRDRFGAVSSAVEHCFHTAGVTGSSPVPPTIILHSPARPGHSARPPSSGATAPGYGTVTLAAVDFTLSLPAVS